MDASMSPVSMSGKLNEQLRPRQHTGPVLRDQVQTKWLADTVMHTTTKRSSTNQIIGRYSYAYNHKEI
jgi:hypothetical protein